MDALLDPTLNHPGDDPDCRHEHATRTHLGGTGHNAQYLWQCPDCGESEVEGYEGD